MFESYDKDSYNKPVMYWMLKRELFYPRTERSLTAQNTRVKQVI